MSDSFCAFSRSALFLFAFAVSAAASLFFFFTLSASAAICVFNAFSISFPSFSSGTDVLILACSCANTDLSSSCLAAAAVVSDFFFFFFSFPSFCFFKASLYFVNNGAILGFPFRGSKVLIAASNSFRLACFNAVVSFFLDSSDFSRFFLFFSECSFISSLFLFCILYTLSGVASFGIVSKLSPFTFLFNSFASLFKVSIFI